MSLAPSRCRLGRRCSLQEAIALAGDSNGTVSSPAAGVRPELRTAPAYARRSRFILWGTLVQRRRRNRIDPSMDRLILCTFVVNAH